MTEHENMIEPDPDNPEEVKEHLDQLIEYWRDVLDREDISTALEFKARCYIDAYQTVRTNVFNATLGGVGEDAQRGIGHRLEEDEEL